MLTLTGLRILVGAPALEAPGGPGAGSVDGIDGGRRRWQPAVLAAGMAAQ